MPYQKLSFSFTWDHIGNTFKGFSYIFNVGANKCGSAVHVSFLLSTEEVAEGYFMSADINHWNQFSQIC